jgi:peroxygenase
VLVYRIIWPTATYVGFRKVGFHPILSFIAIFVIHGTFSFASQDGWLPDLRMPIYVKNIHRTKHGSDSEVYDTEGRFVPVCNFFVFDRYLNFGIF